MEKRRVFCSCVEKKRNGDLFWCQLDVFDIVTRYAFVLETCHQGWQ